MIQQTHLPPPDLQAHMSNCKPIFTSALDFWIRKTIIQQLTRSPAYSVNMSHLLRYAKAGTNYEDFSKHHGDLVVTY